MLGENETRRLSDIIEAGQHAGWHSFEQSLLQACRQDLITEETAMLYASNKPALRQMLDASRGQSFFTRAKMQNAQMIVVPPNPVPSGTTAQRGSPN